MVFAFWVKSHICDHVNERTIAAVFPEQRPQNGREPWGTEFGRVEMTLRSVVSQGNAGSFDFVRLRLVSLRMTILFEFPKLASTEGTRTWGTERVQGCIGPSRARHPPRLLRMTIKRKNVRIMLEI